MLVKIFDILTFAIAWIFAFAGVLSKDSGKTVANMLFAIFCMLALLAKVFI